MMRAAILIGVVHFPAHRWAVLPNLEHARL
jgi:hypothetical protein